MLIPRTCKPQSLIPPPSKAGRAAYMVHARYERGALDEPARLYVTDGRALAVVPVIPCEGDSPACLIPPEAFKAAKCDGRRQGEARIACNGTVRAHSPGGAVVELPAGEGPDDWPDHAALLKAEQRVARPVRVSLNVRILAALADALGTDELTLDLPAVDPMKGHVTGALRVFARYPRSDGPDETRHGLIMPIG